jgi:hypothetical protein
MADAIHGDVKFEKVSKSQARALLAGFDAGPTRYGGNVNGMVTELIQKPWPPGLTVLAMRRDGQTIGVCAWYPRPLPSPGLALPADMYVHLIGLSHDAQGQSLTDGTRLSNALLRQAHRQMNSDAGGKMPASWVYAGPFNKKSHRLFGQHGYRTRAPLPKNDIIRFRPPGLEPELYLKS